MNKALRKAVIAGNWKMNKTPAEAKELIEGIKLLVADAGCDVVVCVPYVDLATALEATAGTNIGVGAENCHWEKSGAYTGEIAANMLVDAGCKYVILGHSERRSYYGETDEILVKKVQRALENNLDVIFCVGEVLAEREAGKHFEVVKSQLVNGLFNLSADQFTHIVVAYEPVWAIGTGKTATSAQAGEMHAFIRKTIADKYGKEVADNTSILYGGSCNPKNADELFSQADVDGGLIGGASLKADDFMAIITARQKH